MNSMQTHYLCSAKHFVHRV